MLVMLAILTGDPVTAVVILVASSVCTLGVGGLLWVGLAILIGSILQLLFPFLRPTADQGPSTQHRAAQFASASDTPGSSETFVPEPLVHYAMHKLQLGLGDDVVRRNLMRNGWSEAQVTAVLPVAHARMAAAQDGIAAGRHGD